LMIIQINITHIRSQHPFVSCLVFVFLICIAYIPPHIQNPAEAYVLFSHLLLEEEGSNSRSRFWFVPWVVVIYLDRCVCVIIIIAAPSHATYWPLDSWPEFEYYKRMYVLSLI
jgi:hypothetical protein